MFSKVKKYNVQKFIALLISFVCEHLVSPENVLALLSPFFNLSRYCFVSFHLLLAAWLLSLCRPSYSCLYSFLLFVVITTYVFQSAIWIVSVCVFVSVPRMLETLPAIYIFYMFSVSRADY